MQRRHKMSIVFAVTVLMSMTGLGVAHAQSGPQFCQPVRADLTAYFYLDGCQSPVGMCTAGEVTGFGGHTIGQADYTAHGIGGEMAGEQSIVTPASAEPATTWSYAGELVISTSAGELVLRDVGVFDTAGGAFSEFARVTSGTGLFHNASGTLFMNGFGFEDGSGFHSEISGTICIPFPYSPTQMSGVFSE